MSLLQVDLLARWRATDRQDAELERALFETVRGISQGSRTRAEVPYVMCWILAVDHIQFRVYTIPSQSVFDLARH
jgi:hypothetical protein